MSILTASFNTRYFVLLKSGIYKEVTAITNKLKKLLYRQEKGKLKRSGNSRPKKMWRFLDKMDQIYKVNPSVSPPFLIDSSRDEDPHDQICTSVKSDEDVEDDKHQKEHAGVYLPSILVPSMYRQETMR